MQNKERIVTFLDPDLYISPIGEEDIDTHFVCVVCTGVVIDPTECTKCESLYCKGCLVALDMACPKRCGANEYTKVNRFAMNSLNKTEFKCMNRPKCDG